MEEKEWEDLLGFALPEMLVSFLSYNANLKE